MREVVGGNPLRRAPVLIDRIVRSLGPRPIRSLRRLSILFALALAIPPAVVSSLEQPENEALITAGFGHLAGSRSIVPKEWVVGFRNEIPPDLRSKVVSDDGKILREFRIESHPYAVIRAGANEDTFVTDFRRHPSVRSFEPRLVRSPSLIPNDLRYPDQWGPAALRLPEAWDLTLGSRGVVIAVTDTGIDAAHTDLATNLWTAPNGAHGWNVVDNNANLQDALGHGTHVAGIVGAVINNAVGVAGTAQVSIMVVRISTADNGGSTQDLIAQGIAWAANNGASVITTSYGGPCPSFVELDAIRAAWNRGILLFAAAGNFDSGEIQFAGLECPARYREEVSVAATGSLDERAWFSKFELTTLDVAAPGVAIWSTVPMNQQFTFFALGQCGASYCSLDGTSMAAPFAAGIAGLIMSARTGPPLTNRQVRDIIQFTAWDLNSPNMDDVSGYGKPDARKAVDLALNHIDGWARVDAPNSRASLNMFSLSGLSYGHLHESTDPEDWYWIDLSAGDAITVIMSGGARGATTGAFGVQLYDPTGRLLHTADDWYYSNSIYHAVANNEPVGMYYIRVYVTATCEVDRGASCNDPYFGYPDQDSAGVYSAYVEKKPKAYSKSIVALAGPYVSDDGYLTMSGFRIWGVTSSLVQGDSAIVEYQYDITTGRPSPSLGMPNYGLRVAARDPSGTTRDFAFTGHAMWFEGRTVRMIGKLDLTSAGVWTLWPSYFSEYNGWGTKSSSGFGSNHFGVSLQLNVAPPDGGGGGGGGSPYVSTWDGNEFRLDNNLLPQSRTLNLIADFPDRYLIQQPLQATRDYYVLKIEERENDTSYLDEARMLIVDHAGDVQIGLSTNLEIATYRSPRPPSRVVDQDGSDQSGPVSHIDGNLSDGSTYYNGLRGNFLLLEFDPPRNSSLTKLIIRSDPPRDKSINVEVQVLSEGYASWITAAVIQPRIFWSTDVVELGAYVSIGTPLVVRLNFTEDHRVDFVGIDDSPPDGIAVRSVEASRAQLSNGKLVTSSVRRDDGTYVVLRPADSVVFLFARLPSRLEARDFILVVTGYYIPQG